MNIALKIKTQELLEAKEKAKHGLVEMLNFVGIINPRNLVIVNRKCDDSKFGYCAIDGHWCKFCGYKWSE